MEKFVLYVLGVTLTILLIASTVWVLWAGVQIALSH